VRIQLSEANLGQLETFLALHPLGNANPPCIGQAYKLFRKYIAAFPALDADFCKLTLQHFARRAW
jgi:hypothetical protein